MAKTNISMLMTNRNLLPPGYALRLGRLIKGVMADKQLTQAELAKRLNVTQVTVSNWKRAILHEPPRKGLEELSREAGFNSISELIAFLHGEAATTNNTVSARQIEQQILDLPDPDKIRLIATLADSLKENFQQPVTNNAINQLNQPYFKNKLRILVEASLAERGWTLEIGRQRLGATFVSFLLDVDNFDIELTESFVTRLIDILLVRVIAWDGQIPVLAPPQKYNSLEDLLESLNNGVRS